MGTPARPGEIPSFRLPLICASNAMAAAAFACSPEAAGGTTLLSFLPKIRGIREIRGCFLLWRTSRCHSAKQIRELSRFNLRRSVSHMHNEGMNKPHYWLALVAVAITAPGAVFAQAQGTAGSAGKPPTTREMNLLCWQEFGELVPQKIRTVLLPMGSLEPHGVIPNGTDNLAPEAMSRDIAGRVDALIAPTLNYGMTESMRAYPGTVSLSSEAYNLVTEDILRNLAERGFKNIIILNGHGGNTAVLNSVATRTASREKVRILVVNWWTLADDITKSVFKQNGGHAGNNETAYIQAVVPGHIHPERYTPEMASPNAPAGAYLAVPVTSSIGLYEKGQGYPTFDPAQAREYFRKVNDRVAELILDTVAKWDRAGIYR